MRHLQIKKEINIQMSLKIRSQSFGSLTFDRSKDAFGPNLTFDYLVGPKNKKLN